MPPPRRRPATPPARRPKVAGLHKRADQPSEEATEQEATPSLDVPVIGEEPPNGQAALETRQKRAVRQQDPAAEAWVEPDDAPASDSDVQDAELPSTSDSDSDSEDVEEDSKDTEPLNLTIPIVLVVVALLLGGLGFWFMQNLSDARVGSGNEVLSDPNATKDVVGAANTAVTSVLSYKFDDMPGATKRAKDHLVGEAVDQYDKSMKALEAEIQSQKLQVVVNPISVGVVSLDGDNARVLVFADQIGTRADKQPSGGPTQFAMNMQRVDGKWKIVKLDFFENPK